MGREAVEGRGPTSRAAVHSGERGNAAAHGLDHRQAERLHAANTSVSAAQVLQLVRVQPVTSAAYNALAQQQSWRQLPASHDYQGALEHTSYRAGCTKTPAARM